jgi:hypothetical protein
MREKRRVVLRLAIATVAAVVAVGSFARHDTSFALFMLAIVALQVFRLFGPATSGKAATGSMAFMLLGGSIFFVAGDFVLLVKAFQEISRTDGSLFLFACYMAVVAMVAVLAYIFARASQAYWRLRDAS